MGLSATAGESRPLLNSIFSKMVPHLADSKGKLAKAGVPTGLEFEHSPWSSSTGTRAAKTKNPAPKEEGKRKSDPGMDAETLEKTLQVPDGLEADNSALVKWASKTVDELVDEGYLTSLMALLVSEHASIRKEALVNILKAAAKIK